MRWMDLADYLSLPVDLVRSLTTSSQLAAWELYRKRTLNRRDVNQWMLAALIAEVACVPFRVWGKEVPKGLDDPKNHLVTLMSQEEFDKKRKKDMRKRRKMDKELSEHRWGLVLGGRPPESAEGAPILNMSDLLREGRRELGKDGVPPAPKTKAESKIVDLERMLREGREEARKSQEAPPVAKTAASFPDPVPEGKIPRPPLNIKKTGQKPRVFLGRRPRPGNDGGG